MDRIVSAGMASCQPEKSRCLMGIVPRWVGIFRGVGFGVDALRNPPSLSPPICQFYETHIPAFQAHAQTAIRLPRPHEDQGRPRHPEPPPPSRPQAASPERCRSPLRQTHPSLSGLDCVFQKPPVSSIAATFARSGKKENPRKVVCSVSVFLRTPPHSPAGLVL